MGVRNQVGIGLSYRPARLHRLHGGVDSLESILGLLNSLKSRALDSLVSMPDRPGSGLLLQA